MNLSNAETLVDIQQLLEVFDKQKLMKSLKLNNGSL